jgi:hypothetical protein
MTSAKYAAEKFCHPKPVPTLVSITDESDEKVLCDNCKTGLFTYRHDEYICLNCNEILNEHLVFTAQIIAK